MPEPMRRSMWSSIEATAVMLLLLVGCVRICRIVAAGAAIVVRVVRRNRV